MPLEQSVLQELLDYDPVTGRLTWKRRDLKWFKAERWQKRWNTRHAGKEAFTSINNRGYLSGCLLGKKVLSQRVIWIWMTGEIPVEVDHEDGVRTNNRWTNLFNKSHQDNSRNQRLRNTNSSGFMGVHFNTKWGKYVAQIREGTVLHLGAFDTAEAASAVYEKAKIAFGYHSNHGRQI
ncbi:HNH endonuclease [Mesorhizobium sp. STM 4661]|uniref:HNH endonuclease n=1 Tax=Mesorhizobium sp. STM 4661 TaxID=1297570 RepID=UPI0002BF8543|nr:HNH endonuclease [Mesorhizobium sp. STM 4661]CCV12983.1 Pathogenesis-related transcriptional factor and ERF protein [Mesorhizobium sp. STM 4661]